MVMDSMQTKELWFFASLFIKVNQQGRKNCFSHGLWLIFFYNDETHPMHFY